MEAIRMRELKLSSAASEILWFCSRIALKPLFQTKISSWKNEIYHDMIMISKIFIMNLSSPYVFIDSDFSNFSVMGYFAFSFSRVFPSSLNPSVIWLHYILWCLLLLMYSTHNVICLRCDSIIFIMYFMVLKLNM